MIDGAHAIIYSHDAEADRKFNDPPWRIGPRGLGGRLAAAGMIVPLVGDDSRVMGKLTNKLSDDHLDH